jgi:hypothetical protein
VSEAPEPGSVEALQADQGFVSRYLAGDADAAAAMHAAIERKVATPPAPTGQTGTDLLTGAEHPEEQAPVSVEEAEHVAPDGASSPLAYDLRPPPGVELDLGMVKGVAEAFHGAGLPVEVGSLLWGRACQLHESGEDAANQELRARTGWAQLTNRLGEREAKAVVADARAYLDQTATKHPKVWEWFERSGLHNDQLAICTLSNLYRARRGAN